MHTPPPGYLDIGERIAVSASSGAASASLEQSGSLHDFKDYLPSCEDSVTEFLPPQFIRPSLSQHIFQRMQVAAIHKAAPHQQQEGSTDLEGWALAQLARAGGW